jgi:hypothetical protein
VIFVLADVDRVLVKGNRRKSPLLRAVVDQPVLADVEVTAPGWSWRIPTVLVNPSSMARWATTSASFGFRTALPITELMFTWKMACLASITSF